MKLHRFDPLSFIAGLLATAIGLAFLIPEDPTDIVSLLDDFGAWFWPVLLVVVGIAIIIPAVAGGKDEELPADTETEPV
jgi:hypothetical protein